MAQQDYKMDAKIFQEEKQINFQHPKIRSVHGKKKGKKII